MLPLPLSSDARTRERVWRLAAGEAVPATVPPTPRRTSPPAGASPGELSASCEPIISSKHTALKIIKKGGQSSPCAGAAWSCLILKLLLQSQRTVCALFCLFLAEHQPQWSFLQRPLRTVNLHPACFTPTHCLLCGPPHGTTLSPPWGERPSGSLLLMHSESPKKTAQVSEVTYKPAWAGGEPMRAGGPRSPAGGTL